MKMNKLYFEDEEINGLNKLINISKIVCDEGYKISYVHGYKECDHVIIEFFNGTYRGQVLCECDKVAICCTNIDECIRLYNIVRNKINY